MLTKAARRASRWDSVGYEAATVIVPKNFGTPAMERLDLARCSYNWDAHSSPSTGPLGFQSCSNNNRAMFRLVVTPNSASYPKVGPVGHPIPGPWRVLRGGTPGRVTCEPFAAQVVDGRERSDKLNKGERD